MIFGGGIWAAIPSFLWVRFNTNEILTSLMLVYVAQLILSYLIQGPMRAPDGYNFPESRLFHDAALLPTLISETRLHAGWIAALFFALHIICIDIFMKELNSPFIYGSCQYFLVFVFSFVVALMIETPKINNIQIEWFEILYTGILSAGVGYTLQIIAQHKANPAPAAIILSMESVFATIAGWLLLSQILDTNKILGCIAIFTGVVIVQLIPIMIKSK